MLGNSATLTRAQSFRLSDLRQRSSKMESKEGVGCQKTQWTTEDHGDYQRFSLFFLQCMCLLQRQGDDLVPCAEGLNLEN